MADSVYGAPRSRCPACEKMVTEGTKHKCPNGRDRDPFINPAVDRKK